MNLKPATKDMLLFGFIGLACGLFGCLDFKIDGLQAVHLTFWERNLVVFGMTALCALIGRFGLKHSDDRLE